MIPLTWFLTVCSRMPSPAPISRFPRPSAMSRMTSSSRRVMGRIARGPTGVIPVPPNFNLGGMRFDFVDLDTAGGSVRSFLKSGADSIQLLYGTPLALEQMNKIT
jgi:hypothetical protein